MNWVGGARNRIKLKYEKKIQKEFFERKRHTKKVLRAKQDDCHENEGKKGISQDLIALQAIVSAHDKPRRKPREVRPPHAIDLDEAKRNDHPRRKYCVELPESPGHHHKPSTLDLCSTIPESSHAQNNHQKNKQSCRQYDIREQILKHEETQKRPLFVVPGKESLSIPQTLANHPTQKTIFREPSPVKERPKPYVSSFNPKPVVREIQNLSWNEKQKSKKVQDDSYIQRGCDDFYCTPIKQRRTHKGKSLCFDGVGFPNTSKSNGMAESKLKPLMCPFVPFSEPGPLSKFNVIKPKDKPDPENKTFHDQTFNHLNGEATQLPQSTCMKGLYTESNKPTQLDTPVQTWTARKTNIDRKDSHWSHFQIQPGHPPRKNPFFDKEAHMEDKPANSEPKGKDNIPNKDNEQLKNAELTDGKTKPAKWNPFNLSYPVKIESGSEGDASVGCGQETAWRTFLKGSKRLSSERLQGSFASNQHADDLPNLGVSSGIVEAPKEGSNHEQDVEDGNSKATNDSFTPESEVRESLHHETLKEVMDLEGDDSELTSSWSSTLTDETGEGNRLEAFDDGHEDNKFISSNRNFLIESDNIEKWQSMKSMSSPEKTGPQWQDVTSNVLRQVKVTADNQSKEVRRGFNQSGRSPTALLECTESIDLFNEIEDIKTDCKQDLGHEGCIESFSDKVESVSDGVKDRCRDKKEPKAAENLEKRLTSTEQGQRMSQEKGSQTQIESLQVTKQREARTTDKGTQTERNISCSSRYGRDAKTTQTEKDKWLEGTRQERASAGKHNCLKRTGNEETPPIPKIDVCPGGNDVVSRNPEHFAVKQLQRGGSKKEVEKSPSPHPVPNNQKSSALDNDDLLSNQRNINWYLSLLINVLTCNDDS